MEKTAQVNLVKVKSQTKFALQEKTMISIKKTNDFSKSTANLNLKIPTSPTPQNNRKSNLMKNTLSPKALQINLTEESSGPTMQKFPLLSQIKNMSSLASNSNINQGKLVIKRRPSQVMANIGTSTGFFYNPKSTTISPEKKIDMGSSINLRSFQNISINNIEGPQRDSFQTLNGVQKNLSKLSQSISLDDPGIFTASQNSDMRILPPTLHEVILQSSHHSNVFPKLDLGILDIKQEMEKSYHQKRGRSPKSRISPTHKDYAYRDELLANLNKISKPRANFGRKDVSTLSNWYKLMCSDLKKLIPPENNFPSYYQTQARLLDFSFTSLSSMLKYQCKENSEALDIFYSEVIILFNELMGR